MLQVVRKEAVHFLGLLSKIKIYFLDMSLTYVFINWMLAMNIWEYG